MKMPGPSGAHLSYCLNVHPGESWANHQQAIREHGLRVRDRVSGGKPFGLGLRIANEASIQLANDPGERERFRAWMAAEGVYAFTINGFPFGKFHGARVKEQVYAPDWQTDERVAYTDRLTEILADWVPEGVEGSISTVPCSFKPWITEPEQGALMARQVARAALKMDHVSRKTGRLIHLGLEPEPACWLETTSEFLDFYENGLLVHGANWLRAEAGLSAADAEALLRRHVGINFDCCHLAIQFEDLSHSLQRLVDAGVKISKIHLSAALTAARSKRAALHPFDEPVYFHQVKGRKRDGTIIGWTDLPDLPETVEEDVEELRVHFHVPLFWPGDATLGTTARMMDADFFAQLRAGVTPHLEIETYTFDVLPPSLRLPDIADSISREFSWVLERLQP